jgi:hypothetical protein
VSSAGSKFVSARIAKRRRGKAQIWWGEATERPEPINGGKGDLAPRALSRTESVPSRFADAALMSRPR